MDTITLSLTSGRQVQVDVDDHDDAIVALAAGDAPFNATFAQLDAAGGGGTIAVRVSDITAAT